MVLGKKFIVSPPQLSMGSKLNKRSLDYSRVVTMVSNLFSSIWLLTIQIVRLVLTDIRANLSSYSSSSRGFYWSYRKLRSSLSLAIFPNEESPMVVEMTNG